MKGSSLQGIVVALITPVNAERDVDIQSLRTMARYVVREGVDGINVLGSTGEGALLGPKDRMDVLQAVLAEVGDQVPVMASVIQTVPTEAVAQAKAAFAEGVEGVLAAPPFYYALSAPAVVDYYRRLAGEVVGPLYVYHIPPLTGVEISMETVEQIADVPGMSGIKDSCGDGDFHEGLLRTFQGRPFKVFAGRGALLELNHRPGVRAPSPLPPT